jgi:hypothetical protein
LDVRHTPHDALKANTTLRLSLEYPASQSLRPFNSPDATPCGVLSIAEKVRFRWPCGSHRRTRRRWLDNFLESSSRLLRLLDRCHFYITLGLAEGLAFFSGPRMFSFCTSRRMKHLKVTDCNTEPTAKLRRVISKAKAEHPLLGEVLLLFCRFQSGQSLGTTRESCWCFSRKTDPSAKHCSPSVCTVRRNNLLMATQVLVSASKLFICLYGRRGVALIFQQ